MNNELLERIKLLSNDLLSQDSKLRDEYTAMKEAGASVVETNKIVDEIIFVDNQIEDMRNDYNSYKAAYSNYTEAIGTTEENKEYDTFRALEESLLVKYDLKKAVSKKEEPEKPKKKKNKNGRRIAAGVLALLLATGAGIIIGKRSESKKTSEPTAITSTYENKDSNNLVLSNDKEETNKSETKEEQETEKPFEVYGEFTDISNEAQLKSRAEWYYNEYIAKLDPSVSELDKEKVIFDLMNDIRYMNGALMLDINGYPTYLESDTDMVSNVICNIYNLKTPNGEKYNYVAMAPLFIDGSKIQNIVLDYDESLRILVDAANKEDDETFVNESRYFGSLFNDTFVKPGMIPERNYLNIYNAEEGSQFYGYSIANNIYSQYIYDYTVSRGLNICVPVCMNYQTCEFEDVTLSHMINDYNTKVTDAVANRAGEGEEYTATHDPAPIVLANKCDAEHKSLMDLGVAYVLR